MSPEEKETKMECLRQALQANAGRGLETAELVAVAEKFYEFVTSAPKE